MDEHIWVVEKWDLRIVSLHRPVTWKWWPVGVWSTRAMARDTIPEKKWRRGQRYRIRKYVPVEEE